MLSKNYFTVTILSLLNMLVYFMYLHFSGDLSLNTRERLERLERERHRIDRDRQRREQEHRDQLRKQEREKREREKERQERAEKQRRKEEEKRRRERQKPGNYAQTNGQKLLVVLNQFYHLMRHGQQETLRNCTYVLEQPKRCSY